MAKKKVATKKASKKTSVKKAALKSEKSPSSQLGSVLSFRWLKRMIQSKFESLDLWDRRVLQHRFADLSL